jgi:hypothetical protein
MQAQFSGARLAHERSQLVGQIELKAVGSIVGWSFPCRVG